MSLRRLLIALVLLGGLILAWVGWQSGSLPGQSPKTIAANVSRQPATFENRSFDPAAPPSDMPPLSSGEDAECDSNFLSSASVSGEPQQTDATHTLVTITQVKVNLQLKITVWTPNNVSPRVADHENGHRLISEHFYESADKIAERIASKHVGERVLISGTDLNAELNRVLQQMGSDITEEYNKELNPGPTQLRYDAITDHSRNDITAQDAVAQALKETVALNGTPANQGN